MAKIRLKYFGYHPYNNPTHSERNVELPIAFWFLHQFTEDRENVIEVGEVTPFYKEPKHQVFDPVPEKPQTIKKTAAEVDYKGKHLLSISTVEHIGTGDYGQIPNPKLLPATLEKMLTSKNYLITFALGYNRQLDGLIPKERSFVLERTAATRWRQVKNVDLGKYRYNSPWYAGNGLCILTNLDGLEFEFSTRSMVSVAMRFITPAWSCKNFAKAAKQQWLDRKR